MSWLERLSATYCVLPIAPVAPPSDSSTQLAPPNFRAGITMDDRTKVQVRKTDGEQGSWTPPSIADDEFRQLIGSSVLEQFVAGHDPMDVVRELVQNEFDAGGAAMSLEFSEDALIVSGTGKFIDAKGWARLGVILGTGTVVGAGGSGSIAPKEDGIGSKNLGLRSLFRFGDRIHVYSNGKMAVLDLPCMGTLQKPDSASRAQAGIKIVVPFREQARGILSGFDADAESHAIDEIAAGLFGTLGKLSLTGRKPGIRKLTVSSVRSGRRLTWSQTSKAANSPAKGISVTVRSGRLFSQAPSERAPRTSPLKIVGDIVILICHQREHVRDARLWRDFPHGEIRIQHLLAHGSVGKDLP